jgi:hypothetical protein
MYRPTHITGFFGALILMLCIQDSHAGSATWDLIPASGDWNTAANWTPATVPNGSPDTAMFALSNTTNVSISANTEVSGITFTATATNPYTITASPGLTLTISGAGITNNSGITQNFVTTTDGASNGGQIVFANNATAANGTFTNNSSAAPSVTGGHTLFNDSSTAGSATINNNGGRVLNGDVEGGFTEFNDSSTAASAMITNYGGAVRGARPGGFTEFNNSSTAGSAAIVNYGPTVLAASGGFTEFNNNSTASSATITNNGATVLSGEPGGFTTFNNSSTAGNATVTNNGASVPIFTGVSELGGFTEFNDSSTAANGTFINNGALVSGQGRGFTKFNDSSTAANGTFINNGGTVTGAEGGLTSFTSFFGDAATAANGTFTNNGGTASGAQGGSTQFDSVGGTATAANGTFTNNGGTVTGAQGGFTSFFGDAATAANGTFTNNGGTASGAQGGSTQFESVGGMATAANGTFTNNGGTVTGAQGGFTEFLFNTTAGNATLIANGGTGGGEGGAIFFEGRSSGGTARVEVFGNGSLDISGHLNPGLTLSSIEGDGNVFLGANKLRVGSNNLNTTFSGVIQDGGSFGGSGGSLAKRGTGTLILSGINTYTGDTNIGNGVLQVDGSITSNTFVHSRLAGTGTIYGSVTNNSLGRVSPGMLGVPGALTVVQNYMQAQSATLMIQIAGMNTGQFSVLNVLGTADLNGNLDPVLLNGFVPDIGQSFTFLNYASFTGGFSQILNQVFNNGTEQWSVTYQNNNAILMVESHTGVVPDQGSTLLLLMSGLLGLVGLQAKLRRS